MLKPIIVGTAIALGTVTVTAPLASCSYFQVKKPETVEDSIALVQSGVGAAQDGLKKKILAGTISKRDAQNVDTQLDSLVEATGVAIDLKAAGDEAGAQAKLETTKALLAVLRKSLGV